MRNPWWSFGLALTWVGAQHAAPRHAQGVKPRVEVVPHEDLRRVDILVDGKPFTSYIYPTTLKKPTLYPVRAASGVVVTRGWPLAPRRGERGGRRRARSDGRLGGRHGEGAAARGHALRVPRRRRVARDRSHHHPHGPGRAGDLCR